MDYVGTAGREGVSVQEIIDKNPITKDETIRKLAALSIGDYEAGDAENLDSGAWSEMTRRTAHNGDNLLIKEGYQPIIIMLSEGIDIRLNSGVTLVDTRELGKVSVTLADGSRISARNIIITVSLGVLQRGNITFLPALPPAKIEAIKKFGMGNAMKLILRFKNPHAISQYLHYGDGDNALLQTITGWWPSAVDPCILTGFTGGSRAKAALELDEDRLIEKVTDDLERISGRTLARWIIRLSITGSFGGTPTPMFRVLTATIPLVRTTGCGRNSPYPQVIGFSGQARQPLLTATTPLSTVRSTVDIGRHTR